MRAINSQDNVLDTRQVRATAADGRLRAIQAQLSLASTLCSVAETEITSGGVDAARNAMQKVQRIGRNVRRHLDEPNHIPEQSLLLTREQLAELEARLQRIAQGLRA